jgi:hypothetical protein
MILISAALCLSMYNIAESRKAAKYSHDTLSELRVILMKNLLKKKYLQSQAQMMTSLQNTKKHQQGRCPR